MCCRGFLRFKFGLIVVGFCCVLLFVDDGKSFADDGKSRVSSAAAFDTSRGDRIITRYFLGETRKLESASLADVKTKEDWLSRRATARQQLFEMLGLDPLPQRTPLKAVITGQTSHQDFTVENVQFQSRPGLYVTGNFYLPKKRKGKLPVILYVCGHASVKDRKTGVSYGNKAHYQHHGAWFARNGYACLTIDTLQLGEIEGIHHGTYRYGMWWWNARGYSPAGVEAWNCIRALDYLATRPEVDVERIGVTGRSGGGAYSWWIAALDDRIKVAVPVAGITSLRNHVVDGCVEGHCDCMYHVNTYRWDFAQVAALVAPRPLLISNSDKDGIFPLDGVVDVYNKTRRIYKLLDAEKNIGLQITEGPHKDTQELRIHAFHWFNRFLKGESPSPLIEMAARKLFDREQLRVFHKLPADQKNTKIQETFTVKATVPPLPVSKRKWESQRRVWMQSLRTKSFRGWPTENPAPLNVQRAFSVERQGILFSAYDFTSQKNIRLRLYLAHRAGVKPSRLKLVMLNALDQNGWKKFVATMSTGFAEEITGESGGGEKNERRFRDAVKIFKRFSLAMAYVAPRGIGPTEWSRNARKRVQYRRRFMLLGQTLDGMRTWDIVRAAKALRSITGMADMPLWMRGEREMAGVTLYASLFVPQVESLNLWHLSTTHRNGPIFLNVLRYLDVPQAVAMAAERSQVNIYESDKKDWSYPLAVANRLKWDKKQIRIPPRSKPSGKAKPN